MGVADHPSGLCWVVPWQPHREQKEDQWGESSDEEEDPTNTEADERSASDYEYSGEETDEEVRV